MSNNDPCYLVKVLSVLEEIENNNLHKGENIHCQDQPDNVQNVCFNQGIHY